MENKLNAQIERINEMEQLFDEVSAAVKELSEAFEKYQSVLPGLEKLTEYFESEQWQADFEDDSMGRLPKDLKRGVLSEDGVYDLLTENAELMSEIAEMFDCGEE